MTDGQEIVERLAESNSGAPPLLFVHGAWHGAWCWEKFQDYFAGKGVSSFAVNLRGHGGRANSKSLKFTRIKDYVVDVATAVEAVAGKTGRRPIVVGHSMGGLVTQKFLEHKPDIPKAILLASVPSQGVWRATIDIAFRHPVNFLLVNLTLSLWPLVKKQHDAKYMFLSYDVPEAIVADFHARLQDESYLGFLDMLLFALPSPKNVDTPLAVWGGEMDTIFPPPVVKSTARAYGVKAEIFDRIAHDMMFDSGWEEVAERLLQEISAANR